MLKLIKWSLIILAVVAIWYVSGFYFALKEEERTQMKNNAKTALEVTVNPLADKIKEDLKDKKVHFYDDAKEKIKDLFKRVFGSDESH